MRFVLFLVLLIVLVPSAHSQETFPINGAKESENVVYALTNATLHADAFTVLEKATLIIKKGKVVGVNTVIPTGAVMIDVKERHIYPSFIDLYSSYGMPVAQSKERSSTPQYNSEKKGAFGWNETLNPERRASLLFKHEGKKAKALRAAGFGTVLTHYADGIHRGSGTLVTLGGNENLNMILPEASAHLSFSKGKSRQSYPNSLMGVIALLRQANYDAQWYASSLNSNEENLTLAAWNELKNVPQVFETREMLDIMRADKIGDEFALQYIFKGNGDEYQRLKEVKTTGGALIVPVNFPKPFDVSDPFLANTIELEELKHWELAPYNAYFLSDQGIEFCFTASGLKDQGEFLSNIRKAIGKGLDKQKALEALTTAPAKMIQMSNEIGKLQLGYWANFIITDKDIFTEGAKILENWVQGEKFEIAKPKNTELVGEFNLTIKKKLYRLRIKDGNKAVLLTESNMEKDDSLGVKMKLSYKKPFITMTYSLKDEKGVYRLTGANLTDGVILEGSGETPEAEAFEWVAVRQQSSGKEKEKEKEKSKKDSLATIDPYDLLIYPFAAYGDNDSLVEETILIKDATIWTCDSLGKIDRGQVLVANGKIKSVGEKINLEESLGRKWEEIDIKEIDGFGLHVTPGIIDEHSHIAISRGVNESSQASTAEVRIGDSVNSEDVNIYRQLAGGVTTSQLLHGSANPIGGQSALIKLRWGENPEKMKFEKAPGFIKFALGENVKQANWGNTFTNRFPQSRMGVEQVYYDHFHKAREYQIEWGNYSAELAGLTNRQRKKGQLPVTPRRDLELDALAEILDSERFVTCHSYMQHEINMLMHVADSMGFTLNTFTHILEGYKVADKMKTHGAGASSFSDWWAYKYEVKDAIPYNGAILWEQGITVAYNSDDAEMARRLNQEAAKAVKYGGVPEEEALKFVTLNPAKLLHVDDRVGSLTPGKDADFVIWNDHPLSVYAKPKATYIDGMCYFSLEKDTELRTYIAKERNRLIQLMAAEGTEGGARMPGKKKSQHYHCNTITNELH